MLGTQERPTSTLPTAGEWQLDPTHSAVYFAADHFGIAKIRGHFAKFGADIKVGEQPEDSSFDAVIDAASINTLFEMRDNHLRSPDFLDVANHREIRFTSRSIEKGGDGWLATGHLTVRGTTQPAVLLFRYHGEVDDPRAQTKRAGFSGTLEFDRHEFGIALAEPMEMSGMVGKSITVEIEAEALLKG